MCMKYMGPSEYASIGKTLYKILSKPGEAGPGALLMAVVSCIEASYASIGNKGIKLVTNKESEFAEKIISENRLLLDLNNPETIPETLVKCYKSEKFRVPDEQLQMWVNSFKGEVVKNQVLNNQNVLTLLESIQSKTTDTYQIIIDYISRCGNKKNESLGYPVGESIDVAINKVKSLLSDANQKSASELLRLKDIIEWYYQVYHFNPEIGIAYAACLNLLSNEDNMDIVKIAINEFVALEKDEKLSYEEKFAEYFSDSLSNLAYLQEGHEAEETVEKINTILQSKLRNKTIYNIYIDSLSHLVNDSDPTIARNAAYKIEKLFEKEFDYETGIKAIDSFKELIDKHGSALNRKMLIYTYCVLIYNVIAKAKGIVRDELFIELRSTTEINVADSEVCYVFLVGLQTIANELRDEIAIDSFNFAVKICDVHPTESNLKSELSNALANYKFDQKTDYTDIVLEELKELYNNNPGNITFARSYARGLYNSGNSMEEERRKNNIAILKKLYESHDRDQEIIKCFSHALNNGVNAIKKKEYSKTLILELRQLTKKHPDIPVVIDDYATALSFHLTNLDSETAKTIVDEIEQLCIDNPSDIILKEAFANGLYNLSIMQPSYSEAMITLQRIQDLDDSLSHSNETIRWLREKTEDAFVGKSGWMQNVTVTGQQGHNSQPAKDTIPGR